MKVIKAGAGAEGPMKQISSKGWWRDSGKVPWQEEHECGCGIGIGLTGLVGKGSGQDLQRKAR